MTIYLTFFVLLSFIASMAGLFFWHRSLRAEERADALYRQRNTLSVENHRLRSALSKEQRTKLEASR